MSVKPKIELIAIGVAIVLMATLVGCVGYVDGGYGGAVVVGGPEVTVFGGGFERGREVHEYSRRGGDSRAAGHSGGREREVRR
jgi:hypothetical protein